MLDLIGRGKMKMKMKKTNVMKTQVYEKSKNHWGNQMGSYSELVTKGLHESIDAIHYAWENRELDCKELRVDIVVHQKLPNLLNKSREKSALSKGWKLKHIEDGGENTQLWVSPGGKYYRFLPSDMK